MPRWVTNAEPNGVDSSESSVEDSDEEKIAEGEEEEFEEGDQLESAGNDDVAEGMPSTASEQADQDEAGPSSSKSQSRGKISLSLSKLRCHVCGKQGHNAGFVGAVYMDCPNKPCYLCKLPGHTTMSCPYRVAPDYNSQATNTSTHGVLAGILLQQCSGRRPDFRFKLPSWQVDAAILKLHSRRCTCLQFHPTKDNLVLSGDKFGQVAVWDQVKVYERTVWKPNEALTNNLVFLPGADGTSCCSSSSDGTLKVLDLELSLVSRELLNLNPGGWIPGETTEKSWRTLNGLDLCGSLQLLAAGDSQGIVHFRDARSSSPAAAAHQLHKKGNKVNSVQFCPADDNLMVTGSNDWTARLFDIRKLSSSNPKGKETAGAPMELAKMEHPKVVNSAYFSPVTGRKLLTTCIDNRIRVWDYLLFLDKQPSRQIVHSHDFNRYLTPFRAEWDPKDHRERLIVVGRYISEDFGGLALHPVDLLDVSTGKLLDQLKDPNLTTICPVNKFHPRLDVIVSGSSRSLYAWKPAPELKPEAEGRKSAAADSSKEPNSSTNFLYFDASVDGEKQGKKKRRLPAPGSAEEDRLTSQEDDEPKEQMMAEKQRAKSGALAKKEMNAASHEAKRKANAAPSSSKGGKNGLKESKAGGEKREKGKNDDRKKQEPKKADSKDRRRK